jgi:hypothetical protein
VWGVSLRGKFLPEQWENPTIFELGRIRRKMSQKEAKQRLEMKKKVLRYAMSMRQDFNISFRNKRYCYLHKHKNKVATTQTSTNDYVLGQIMTYPQEHNVIGNY